MNPQGAFLYSYRLSAVFFLPAENGCCGESRARRQHERNPESGIAVIASLWGIFPRRLLSILDSIAAAIGRSRRLFVLAVIRCPGCRDFYCIFFVAAYGTFFMLQPGFRGSRFLVRYPLKRMGAFIQFRAALTGIPMAVFIKMPACAIGGMRRFINLAIFLPANFADCFLRTGSCAALMCRIFVYSVTTWIGTRLPMPMIVVRPLRSPLMYVMICSDYFSARRYRRWRLYPCISSREIYVPLHSFESDIV